MPIKDIRGVLCCGNICLDIPVAPVERIEWGTTTWVETIEESLGGNGANTSYALAKLGLPVNLTGVVGADAPGDKVLSILRDSGVDASGVRRTDLPTTSTICVVHPSGERLFLHRPGASSAAEERDVQFDACGTCNHFHLANPFALPKVRLDAGKLMQRARSAGFTTSLDAGWDALGRWIEDIGPCLPHTNLMFINDREAKMLTGLDDSFAAVAALQRYGATDVVVKSGARGCTVFRDGHRTHHPAYPVNVVDTTGAGDCFAGGFLAALGRGRSYAEAARFANAVGALNVQRLGAAQGVLSFAETEAWIASRSTLENL